MTASVPSTPGNSTAAVIDDAATGNSTPAGFTFGYWLLMTIEMMERLAYYTLRPIAAIFIMQASEPGGLKMTALHNGTIYFWWAIIQAILPIVTGGFADRYGYKRLMIISMLLNVAGYGYMAMEHSYQGFFIGVIFLACGTSFFKPSIQGAMAQSLSKSNSSLGWGIFYAVVNIGAYFGHILSPVVLGTNHTEEAYRNLFLFCAGFCVLNIFLVFTFRDVASGASKTDSPFKVLWSTIINIFEPRLLSWLIIMSCFWMMMYQLWDLAPNFIEDWVDSSGIAAMSPIKTWQETGPDGTLRVPQQVLLSLNSLMIIFFVAPVSHIVRRLRTLSAMMFGMMVVTAGVLLAGMTQSGWMLLAGICFFSLGEMLTGPKKSEYLALIAPKEKKGLYLGYVMIPTGIGQGVGNWLSGMIYARHGEKAILSLKYLLNETPFGQGKTWDGDIHTLETAVGVSRPEAYEKLQQVLGKTGPETTSILWDFYHPEYWSWLPFATVGFLATIALYVFGRMAKKWSDMNA
ncbi:MAG: MFS transporter [Planctomycetes bacterium]|nr:MFS transporter [Planctomycetota bacterium]